MLTVVRTGGDVPDEWFDIILEWGRAHEVSVGDTDVVLERGDTELHLHIHSVTHIVAADTKACKQAMRRDVRNALGYVGPGKIKIDIRRAGTPTNARLYLCKQASQPWFRAANTDGATTDDPRWKDREEQWHAANTGDWGDFDWILAKDVEKHVVNHRNAAGHDVLDAGFGDFLYWSLRSNPRLALHPEHIGQKAFKCPRRTAAFIKQVTRRQEFTRADLYVLMFGLDEKPGKGKLKHNMYTNETNGGNGDLLVVDDVDFANPRYWDTTTLAEAVLLWNASPVVDYSGMAGREHLVVSRAEMYPWQAKVYDDMVKGECPKHGRTIHWIYDAEGNSGKSTVAKALSVRPDAMYVTISSSKDGGATDDVLYAIAERCDRLGPPRIIVINVPRSVDVADFDMVVLEHIKDGQFFSSKYKPRSVLMAKPTVVVFANVPPDTSTMSEDRWNIRTTGDIIASLPSETSGAFESESTPSDHGITFEHFSTASAGSEEIDPTFTHGVPYERAAMAALGAQFTGDGPAITMDYVNSRRKQSIDFAIRQHSGGEANVSWGMDDQPVFTIKDTPQGKAYAASLL